MLSSNVAIAARLRAAREKQELLTQRLKSAKDNNNDVSVHVDMVTDARFLGQGTYNTVYALEGEYAGIALRISTFFPHILSQVGRAIVRDPRTRFKGLYRAYVQPHQRHQASTQLAADPVLIKNNFSRLTNTLIRNNICPHFVYMFAETDIKDFNEMVIQENPARSSLDDRYSNVSYHEVMDRDLLSAIQDMSISNTQLKSVLFQVAFAVCILQHYLPGFRHNDLWLSNVFLSDNTINQPNHKKPGSMAYTILGQSYTLTNTDVLGFIADFDLAFAPFRVAEADPKHTDLSVAGRDIHFLNDFITNNQFQNANAHAALAPHAHASFDMFMLLVHLFNVLTRTQARIDKYVDTLNFISDVIRDIKQIQAGRVRYAQHDIGGLDPFGLLNHPYFAEVVTRTPASAQTAEQSFGPKPLGLAVRYVVAEEVTQPQSYQSTSAFFMPHDQGRLDLVHIKHGDIIKFYN